MDRTFLALMGFIGALIAVIALAGFRRAPVTSRFHPSRSMIGPARTGNSETVRFLPSEKIAGRTVAEWIPGSAGRHPLIVFSHGYGGSRLQSKKLLQALAEDGYIVVAPDHRDAGALTRSDEGDLSPFRDPENWNNGSHRDRADDVKAILAEMHQSPSWSAMVDWEHIGLAGHSLGGYTVLALGGAWPSWRLPEVKAVLALSPYAQPFILQGTLKALAVPVMYQGGTLDFGITPSIRKNRGAYDLTPSPAYYVEFRRAGHFAWTDLNPKFQASITAYATAFFDKYLRGQADPGLESRRPDVVDLRWK